MRAIDSAVALARDLNTELDIFWVRGTDLNCPFRLLFEPIPDHRVRVHERRIRPLIFLRTKRQLRKLTLPLFKNQISFAANENEALKSFDFKSLSENKNVVIESFGRFYLKPDRFQIFKPIESLRQRISERAADFDQYTIGVHVRRTDHAKSIALSPDELYIAQMQSELHDQPLTRFYLATDSMGVKKKFTDVFGSRILTTPFKASRNTIEGVQEALVELYTLAQTSKILGSGWSSYATTAAKIGNIKMQTTMLPKISES